MILRPGRWPTQCSKAIPRSSRSAAPIRQFRQGPEGSAGQAPASRGFRQGHQVEITGPKLNLTFSSRWQSENGSFRIPRICAWIDRRWRRCRQTESWRPWILGATDADTKKSASCFQSGTPGGDREGHRPIRPTQVLQVRKEQGRVLREVDRHGRRFKVSNDLGAAVNKSTDDFREKRCVDLRDDDPGQNRNARWTEVVFSDPTAARTGGRTEKRWIR